MVKRAIGIDIAAQAVRAVQMVRKDNHVTMEKSAIYPTKRTTDHLTDILLGLTTQSGFDWRADVAAALDFNTVFYRDFKNADPQWEPLLRHDPEIISHCFPFAQNNADVQLCHCPAAGGPEDTVLLCATARDAIEARLDALNLARLAPRLLDADIFAVTTSALINYPILGQGRNLVIYVDAHHLVLAVLDERQVVAVRQSPLDLRMQRQGDTYERFVAELISEEARLTWHKAFHHDLDERPQVAVAVGCAFSEELARVITLRLGCPAFLVEPGQRIEAAPDLEPDNQLIAAQGLALRLLLPEQSLGVNFNQNRKYTRTTGTFRKELTWCGSLLAAIVLVWVIGLFTELSSLESSYAQVKARLEETFRQTLPEETACINPVAQLQQKIDACERRRATAGLPADGCSPLQLLQHISESRPLQAGIVLQDVQISGSIIRITAVTDSFEQPYQWQHELQKMPVFADARIVNPKKDPKNRQVSFTLEINLKETS